MNPLRRSYEAKVLVIPMGSASRQLAADLAQFGLNGIRMLSTPAATRAGTEVLGEGAWSVPESAGVNEIVEAADMVVLLGADLTEVPVELVHEVGRIVQAHGLLSAAVLVNASHWQQAEGSTAMIALRQNVDMVVSVQDARLAAALVDVLRGGSRPEAGRTLSEEVRA